MHCCVTAPCVSACRSAPFSAVFLRCCVHLLDCVSGCLPVLRFRSVPPPAPAVTIDYRSLPNRFVPFRLFCLLDLDFSANVSGGGCRLRLRFPHAAAALFHLPPPAVLHLRFSAFAFSCCCCAFHRPATCLPVLPFSTIPPGFYAMTAFCLLRYCAWVFLRCVRFSCQMRFTVLPALPPAFLRRFRIPFVCVAAPACWVFWIPFRYLPAWRFCHRYTAPYYATACRFRSPAVSAVTCAIPFRFLRSAPLYRFSCLLRFCACTLRFCSA